MTPKPLYNALLAVGYIAIIVNVIFFGARFTEGGPENILMPIGVLSLFVLSAAIMAFLFFYQPILLLLDGKRPEGVKLFLQTILYFAIIALVILGVAMGITIQ